MYLMYTLSISYDTPLHKNLFNVYDVQMNDNEETKFWKVVSQQEHLYYLSCSQNESW